MFFSNLINPILARRRRLRATNEPWPPQWKPFEECPQYVYGMMGDAANECIIEDLIDVGNHRIFMQQLRDSRGYDIDCDAPNFLPYNFRAVPPWFWKSHNNFTIEIEFALKKINEQAKKHGEFYQLQDIVRIVENRPHRCCLYTFNVRQIASHSKARQIAPHSNVKSVQAMLYKKTCDIFELLEWRFRPGPPETPPEPELPPPESPSGLQFTVEWTVDEIEDIIESLFNCKNGKNLFLEEPLNIHPASNSQSNGILPPPKLKLS